MSTTSNSNNTDRGLLSKWWSDAWSDGLWAASWEKSLEGLTPAQAAWRPAVAPPTGGPASPRHSIWQNVLHMLFWREDALRRLTDPTKPSEDTVAKLNFPEVTDASQSAWDATRARLKASQDRIAAAFNDPNADISRLMYMLPHDAYHMGQIGLIRGMLGLKAIE